MNLNLHPEDTAAFEAGFITRLAERIESERKATVEEVVKTSETGMTTDNALMVVNNAMTRVQAWMDERFGSRGRGGVGAIYGQKTSGAGSGVGYARGKAAADRISLRAPSKALKG